MSDKSESELFGALLGLIKLKGKDTDDAIDEAADLGYDRETAEELVDKHFND